MAKRKQTVDSAYESILRAFESPDQQFDELGDDDKNDIDKNFQDNKGDAEGKSFAEWDKVKEEDSTDGEAFSSEDVMPISELEAINKADNLDGAFAPEDVILPVDDDIEEDDIGNVAPTEEQDPALAEIEQEMEEFSAGIGAQKFEDSESFKEDDLENINKAFSEDYSGYDGVSDYNADRKGVAKSEAGWKDVVNPDKAGFDAGDILAGNALTKVGQNQEPNKELGDRKTQLSKELAALEADFAQEDDIPLGDDFQSDIVIIDEEDNDIIDYNKNQNFPLNDDQINRYGDTSDNWRGDGSHDGESKSKENSEKKNHSDLEDLHTENLDNDGLNKSDNQAGNVFSCPECGFKTISKDEYDDHNAGHSNIPATVDSPEALSEESIGQPNNDHAILSRFKND